MKKLAAALAMALTLSLAAPAFAAVELGGKLENKFTLHEVADEWRVDGETGIDVEVKVTGENGPAITGTVELGLKSGYNDKDELDGTHAFDDLLEGVSLADIVVEKAWVESKGAFWNGGPALTTKLGDVNPEWNPIVAYFENGRGVTVEGLELGPVTAKAFYLWDGADRPMGLAAESSVEGINLHGLVVRKGEENNFLIGAGTDLVPGIALSGQVALDAENRRLYSVEAVADNLVDGVKVKAGYRGADDLFDPMFPVLPEDKDGNPVARNDADNIHWDTLTGFSVGAETVQHGVRLAADYDQPHELLNLEADTDLYGFTVGYAAKIQKGNPMEHTVKAKTVIDTIDQLRGLGLSAEMKLVGDDMSWKTKAEYTAPNGIELGAEYDSEEGASATAGVTLRF